MIKKLKSYKKKCTKAHKSLEHKLIAQTYTLRYYRKHFEILKLFKDM